METFIMFYIHTNTYQTKQTLLDYPEVFPEEYIEDTFNYYHNDFCRKGKMRRPRVRKEVKYSTAKKISRRPKIYFQLEDDDEKKEEPLSNNKVVDFEHDTDSVSFCGSVRDPLNVIRDYSEVSYTFDDSFEDTLDLYAPHICDDCSRFIWRCLCSDSDNYCPYALGYIDSFDCNEYGSYFLDDSE